MDEPRTPPSTVVSLTSPSATILFAQSSSVSFEGKPKRLELPPRQLWHCSDFEHCGQPTGGYCDPATVRTCPGFPEDMGPTPPSFVRDIEHPDGPETVATCGQCRAHRERLEEREIPLITTNADTTPCSGYRIQLCRTCIRDEVELYWLRQANLPDPAWAQNTTLALAKAWPERNGIQDLCTCERNFTMFARDHCHACRDTAFTLSTVYNRDVNEVVLRHCNKAVITGQRPHRLYDNIDAPENRVSDAVIARRAANGIGRMCPCGEKPKQQITPEYITFCIACSGVRIDPRFLPPELQEEPVMASCRRRQTLRNPDRHTKGPVKATKNYLNRVNIECGWMEPDEWINGA